MRSKSPLTLDQKWRLKFGKNMEALILKAGYNSVYDFWNKKARDDISRAAINLIVAGKSDPKISTLRTLGRLLQIEEAVFFELD